MSELTIQDILATIEQPSRYLGTETNVIRKDHHRVDLSIALAFPDLYDIGTSHFGMQILYHILNQRDDVAAERVFAPGIDMQAQIKSQGKTLTTLETGRPLGEFDLIGFSLLYELNYTNVLSMLDLARIPLLSNQREDNYPLIIAGGPCTCNPEPVADFFDAMVIGDGERVVIEMVNSWKIWRRNHQKSKRSLLERWSEIEGVYIPQFFTPFFDESGKQKLKPVYSNYTGVKRSVVPDLNKEAFPEKPIVPFGRPVHDRLRLEVSRGCTRGCRFCQAGMIYRPVRERSPSTLLAQTDKSLVQTGYEDISLLSLSTGDYGCIEGLMEALMQRCATDHIAISLPSLRAGTLTPELMRIIKKVRKTGFTIAPEAGSQRLRNVINKNISEKEIVETIENAFALGWQVIKLYFMIGLPTETEEDIDAITNIVRLVRKIKKPARRKGQINVSVATFIPKPHTPFQWVDQIPLDEARQKVKRLRRKLNLPGVRYKWQPPEVSQIEGLWARGDRRLGRLLVEAFRLGCRFDGWSDHFNHALWQKACHAAEVDIDTYTGQCREPSEPLPWDHIDTGVSKEYLRDDYRKALSEELTGDCRFEDCNQCGVCDFKKIAPVIFSQCGVDLKIHSTTPGNEQQIFRKNILTFSKSGPARFLGHLEMASVFVRAFRRSNIRLKYSEGYHPKPKLNFLDALPVGMESLKEYLVINVSVEVTSAEIVSRLNAHLPEGLKVTNIRDLITDTSKFKAFSTTYRVRSNNSTFHEKQLKITMDKTEWITTKTSRKGKSRKIDLRPMVLELIWVSSSELKMTLRTLPGQVVRPKEVVSYIFDISSNDLKQLRMIKEDNHIEYLTGTERLNADG
jgi:radical SAM family uncharacterized protein/radical SAM-linked protein